MKSNNQDKLYKHTQTFLIVISFVGGAFAIISAFFIYDASQQVSVLSFGIGFIAITLGVLTTQGSNKDAIQIKESLAKIQEEINEINGTIKQFDESSKALAQKIDEKDGVPTEHQKLQNERLNNIEEELKKHQQKPSAINLLPIFINKKNENDLD